MNWIKNNIMQMSIIVILVYLLIQIALIKSEIDEIKVISTKTAHETELNNSKLDYVESDINSKFVDSVKKDTKK